MWRTPGKIPMRYDDDGFKGVGRDILKKEPAGSPCLCGFPHPKAPAVHLFWTPSGFLKPRDRFADAFSAAAFPGAALKEGAPSGCLPVLSAVWLALAKSEEYTAALLPACSLRVSASLLAYALSLLFLRIGQSPVRPGHTVCVTDGWGVPNGNDRFTAFPLFRSALFLPPGAAAPPGYRPIIAQGGGSFHCLCGRNMDNPLCGPERGGYAPGSFMDPGNLPCKDRRNEKHADLVTAELFSAGRRRYGNDAFGR